MTVPCFPRILVLIAACVAAGARGDAVQTLRLILPPQPDPIVEHIARVLVRQIRDRCDAWVVGGEAPLSVELALDPGIGPEGF
ncbi:MAG TPA: hypothetical protein DCM87_06495, partial [Planctomycetes bacterium]|nr:hypothetical protein [Planctomycetota bacterium]